MGGAVPGNEGQDAAEQLVKKLIVSSFIYFITLIYLHLVYPERCAGVQMTACGA